MSHNFRTSHDAKRATPLMVLWAFSPAIVTLLFQFFGYFSGLFVGEWSVAALGLVSLLVGFVLAYTWSVHMLSDWSLGSVTRAVLAVPVALAMMMINLVAAMMGCSVIISTSGNA